MVNARAGQFTGIAAISKHGDPVGDFLDFLEPMGDIDHAEAVLAQVADDIDLRGIKFFCLDQHFFAHADLAKIVQQAGIADFPHLIAAEMNAGV